MANDDQIAARGGLRPSTQPYGTVKRSYYRLTTGAFAVYIGQPMDLNSNGEVGLAASNTAASTFILGPALGFSSDSRGQNGLPSGMTVLTQEAYLPAYTNAYVCIADDPNQEFIIQEASSGTQLTTANIGQNCGFEYIRGSSGSTVTGASYAELYAPFLTAASSASLRVVGLADNMNSDGTYNSVGAYAKWRVRINTHRLNPTADGAVI